VSHVAKYSKESLKDELECISVEILSVPVPESEVPPLRELKYCSSTSTSTQYYNPALLQTVEHESVPKITNKRHNTCTF